jgi:hypothetical protein
MRYRLPLELELTILELAAPPLAIDSLHDRVAFFINISLVHRSLTAWAQERLRDQFLYTYHRRSDEHERLKARFAAGFGRDRLVRRLYLDLSDLPAHIVSRTRPGTDSVSTAVNGHVCNAISLASVPGGAGGGGTRIQKQGCESIAYYVQNDAAHHDHWELCAMITSYSQALDTLWLKLPPMRLDISALPRECGRGRVNRSLFDSLRLTSRMATAPRVLYIDNGAFDGYLWGWFRLLPLSSETVLFLRDIDLTTEQASGRYNTRHIILHDCWATEASLSTVLDRFPQLETVVFFEPEIDDLASVLNALPTPIRRVHILEHNFKISVNQSDPPRVLPHLESFLYTSLSSWVRASRMPADDEPDADALADVQQAIESIIAAPRCTFKYVQSTESPEEALASALATFKL